MKVTVASALPAEPLDTVALALAEGDDVPAPYTELVARFEERGEIKRRAGAVGHLHDGDTRLIVVGLGAGTPSNEDLRVAGAHAIARAQALGTSTLHWLVPAGAGATAALTEGTLLRAWRYEARRKEPAANDPATEALVLVGGDAAEATAATITAEAANWARTQQHEPPNVLTPTELGARAVALADLSPHLEITVADTEELAAKGMGALLGVAQGSTQPPAVITAQYRHPEATGPTLALVGKAVTFDAGGISIKPSARMHEMKFDMSGGAVVLGALQAVARLDLKLNLMVVVGATENLPDGNAFKPGDIITAADGTTIEITNTDAEGRLVLADCLWHARQEGADVLVDVATLTGAVTVALGSTHAGLVSTDDDLAGELLEAGQRTGELAWRLPLHPEYAKLMNSPDADVVNGALERKAGTITGGYFLSRFAGTTPWAHLDIAGTAWGLGRAYAGRGGSAYSLRLLVDWLRTRAA
ncbi:MAG: leucyl aminopeptidase family protein [Patulibacter minatonensis]